MPIARLVVCTAFFGTDRHELVRPDLTKKKREVYQRAAARGDQSKMKEIEDKFDKQWKVGFEIDSPATEVQRVKCGDKGEPSELSFSHMRRGHLHRYRVGPRNADEPEYRIHFQPPVRVRPDLPFREPSQGYKLTPKNLEGL